MKILEIIKTIVKVILAVIFFAFAISMTVLLLNYNDFGVTQFSDTSLILIKGEVSSPNYKKGDLVVVQSRKISDIKEGEVIFVYKVDSSSGKASIDLGTVGKVSVKDDAIALKNGDTYAMKFVIGESTKTYHTIGTYLSIIESKWGFLFIVLVPSFLIFIYQIYALVIEIKYGKDEPANA